MAGRHYGTSRSQHPQKTEQPVSIVHISRFTAGARTPLLAFVKLVGSSLLPPLVIHYRIAAAPLLGLGAHQRPNLKKRFLGSSVSTKRGG